MMENSKAEALKRGFKTYDKFYAYRVSMKKVLRKNNVVFDKDTTTDQLEEEVKKCER